MIIKLENKPFDLVFVHIQKSGGSSIVKYFDTRKSHNKISQDVKEIKKSKEKLKNYFKFTVVRNPWDRMVSFFHYHKERIRGGYPIAHWEYIKNLNFGEFLKSVPFQKWAIKNNITDYIFYKKKPLIDCYLNFENLNKDFQLIKKISGIYNKFPHVNAVHHRDYKKYFKKEDNLKIIKDFFHKEIEFFNFEFGEKTSLKKLNSKDIIVKFMKK